MEDSIDRKIFRILKWAGNHKDKIKPLCGKYLRYYGKKKGYLYCIKCWPNQKGNEGPSCSKKCEKHCK